MNNIPRIMFNDCTSDDAKIIIFGAPFDGTVCFRPGARFGPQAIRDDFLQLESYSPLLDLDMEDSAVYDSGDLEIPRGSTVTALDMIYDEARRILAEGKIPFMLGGEHLVTLGTARAVLEKYSDVVFIHLDAHTDLREELVGQELSHATVLRRVWDLVGDGRIYQFGIRSGLREEFRWAEEGHTFLHKFDLKGIEQLPAILKDTPVYVTVDLDVLDPSLMHGTGTPEAGGITYRELEQLFVAMRALNIVGCDIVELAPHYDASGVSTAAACKTLREMLLAASAEK